jgi:uncharacterized protein YjbJ (UPF0337 family)
MRENQEKLLMKAKGKRQKAKGKRQKAKGKRQNPAKATTQAWTFC